MEPKKPEILDSETGMYLEESKTEKRPCVRFDTTRTYTKEQKEKQRNQFREHAKNGNLICLTDLFSNHGM